MSRPKSKEKKDGKDKKDKDKDRDNSSLTTWETEIVPGRFTLLDWHQLIEEEESDLRLLSIVQSTVNRVFQECLDSYAKKYAISYAVSRTRQQILDFFEMLDLDNAAFEPLDAPINVIKKEVDAAEPLERKLDTMAHSKDFARWVPGFKMEDVQGRKKEPHEHREVKDINYPLFMASETFDKHRSQLKIMALSKSDSLQDLYLQQQRAKPVTFAVHSTTTSDEKPKSADEPDKEQRAEELMISEIEEIDEEKVTKQKTEKSKNHWASEFFETETDEPLKTVKQSNLSLNLPRRVSTKKSTPVVSKKSRAYERLEPSNFPVSRIKTGFSIKESEIVKDTGRATTTRKGQPTIQKAPVTVTPAKIKSHSGGLLMPTPQSNVNVMIMPPVLESVHLSEGVQAREDSKVKSQLFKNFQATSSMLDRVPSTTTGLRQLSTATSQPRVMISQFVSNTPPVVRKTRPQQNTPKSIDDMAMKPEVN